MLPIVKETAFSLYPVVGLALVAIAVSPPPPCRPARLGGARVRRRDRRRSALEGPRARVPPSAAVGREHRWSAAPPKPAPAASSASEALAHPLDYLTYLWQSLLPRLPFMTDHFPTTHFPAMVIFVERGWGAFGWYDVFFPHRLYYVILAAMIAVPDPRPDRPAARVGRSCAATRSSSRCSC